MSRLLGAESSNNKKRATPKNQQVTEYEKATQGGEKEEANLPLRLSLRGAGVYAFGLLVGVGGASFLSFR
jgi:hypothetical protein